MAGLPGDPGPFAERDRQELVAGAPAAVGGDEVVGVSLGSAPLVARTQYWYARLLADRGGPGDLDRAAALGAVCAATATELGMRRLEQQVRALGLVDER
ncbi:hypothetical protein BH24ACT6_BH24ACT6_19350 [soil metagenome]